MKQSFTIEERAAAYLADSVRAVPDSFPWSKCDVQKVIAILQSNKVPLVSLSPEPRSLSGAQGGGRRVLLDAPEFVAARSAEEQVLDGLRAEYRMVKETLAARGIPDVMIKSVGRAPSFPYRSDNLDVLYRPQDEATVRNALRDLRYVELRNFDEPLKYLFRKFHAGQSISAIHVHIHVGWMVSFLDEQAMWTRCSVSDDDPLVMVPSPEDALLTTLAHYFYEDKRVVLLDVVKFVHCLRRRVDWGEVYRVATWRGWRDGLNVSLLLCAYQERALYGETSVPPEILERSVHELPAWARTVLERHLSVPSLLAYLQGKTSVARDGVDSAPQGVQAMRLRIPFVFSKIFFYAKLVRDSTRSIGRRIKDLAVHTGYGTKLRLHIHSQDRMLITLSGVDGCGKTTQAAMLQSAFETCYIRVRQVWSRGGSAPWLGPVTRLGKRWLQGANPVTGMANESMPSANLSQADKVPARQQGFRSPWARWAWSWLTALELLLHYTWNVTLPLCLGRVVICDRYVFDTFADWAMYFGEAAVEERLPGRLLRLLTPRPSLSYWLDVQPEVAASRSNDSMPMAFIAGQREAYGWIAQQHGLRKLDGSLAAEVLSDQITYEVLGTYFAKYGTFINAVFLRNPGQWR